MSPQFQLQLAINKLIALARCNVANPGTTVVRNPNHSHERFLTLGDLFSAARWVKPRNHRNNELKGHCMSLPQKFVLCDFAILVSFRNSGFASCGMGWLVKDAGIFNGCIAFTQQVLWNSPGQTEHWSVGPSINIL